MPPSEAPAQVIEEPGQVAGAALAANAHLPRLGDEEAVARADEVGGLVEALEVARARRRRPGGRPGGDPCARRVGDVEAGASAEDRCLRAALDYIGEDLKR